MKKTAPIRAKPAAPSQTLTVSQQVFQGPIPHPDILLRYDTITPGLADRIVRMAEEEGAHVRAQQQAALSAEIKAQSRGQWIALAALTLCLSASVALAWLGATSAAGVVGGTTVVGVVATFALGRLRKPRNGTAGE